MTKQTSWKEYKKTFGDVLTAACLTVVSTSIKLKLITLSEWENRFKDYCDNAGHSFVHYLEANMNGCDTFLTMNDIMLNNRKELNKRFKAQISSTEDFE